MRQWGAQLVLICILQYLNPCSSALKQVASPSHCKEETLAFLVVTP